MHVVWTRAERLLLPNEISVYIIFVFIVIVMIAKMPHLHLVGAFDKEQNNCLLHFFSVCIHQFEKRVLYILLIVIRTHTRTQTNIAHSI